RTCPYLYTIPARVPPPPGRHAAPAPDSGEKDSIPGAECADFLGCSPFAGRSLLGLAARRCWMRIGIDMIGVQDPGAHGRGVERYVAPFVDSLVAADPANHFILYFFES